LLRTLTVQVPQLTLNGITTKQKVYEEQLIAVLNVSIHLATAESIELFRLTVTTTTRVGQDKYVFLRIEGFKDLSLITDQHWVIGNLLRCKNLQ